MRDQNYDSTKALLLYANQRPILEELSDQERGRLLMALLDYAAEGLEPEFTGVLRMAFLVLQRDVDRNNRRWEETCRRRSAAGKKAAEARSAKFFAQDVSCENDKDAKNEALSPAEPEADTGTCVGAYSDEGPDGADSGAYSEADPDEADAGAYSEPVSGSDADLSELTSLPIFHDRQQTLPNVTIDNDRQQTLPNVTIDNDRQRSATNVGNQNQNRNQNQNQNQNRNQNQKNTPSQPPRGREREFQRFWEAYPRKVGKKSARRAFDGAEVPLDRLLEALARQRGDPQWKRENGRFIPHPATWLNQGRWEDEVPGADEVPRAENLNIEFL